MANIYTWTQKSFPGSVLQQVGANGSIFTSLSGNGLAIWNSSDLGQTFAWAGNVPGSGSPTWAPPAWNGSLFASMRYGSNNALSSADGVTWTARAMPSSGSWIAIASDASGFAAIRRQSSAAAYSASGTSWSASTMPSSEWWSAICAHGAGNFVAVAGNYDNGINTTAAAVSADSGATWSASTLPASLPWQGVASNGSRLVAVAGDTGSSNAATSDDGGATWTSQSLTLNAVAVLWTGTHFVAIGHGTDFAVSSDGVTWTTDTVPYWGSWASMAHIGDVVVVMQDANDTAYLVGSLPSAPGAPTGLTVVSGAVTGGSPSADVSFTAPADGGSAITGYTVTSDPDALVGTGASSPVNVPGLSYGTAYTFTAVATNALGDGPSSAPSASFTPNTYFAAGFATSRFGIPSTPLIASGFASSAFGSPSATQEFRAASIGRTSRFGTPTTPTDRTLQASGFASSQFGRATAVRFAPAVLRRILSASGFRSSAFGTPSAAPTVSGQASGFASSQFGEPTSQVNWTGEATGIASTSAFGTPSSAMVAHAQGFRSSGFGTPTAARVLQASSIGATSRFGTPTAECPNVHQALSLGSTSRFGTPRAVIQFPHQASGFATSGFGTPSCQQVYRATGFGPTSRFGTPLLERISC